MVSAVTRPVFQRGPECAGSAWSRELHADITVHMSDDTKAGGYPQVEILPGQAVDGSGRTKTMLAVVQAAEHSDPINAAWVQALVQ